jgi:hypothetical protein
MKSSIGAFLLRFGLTLALFVPDGFARDPNTISLCPPSLRMTEQDGCQPNNGLRSGTLLPPIKDDAAEQWNQIVSHSTIHPLKSNLVSGEGHCGVAGH